MEYGKVRDEQMGRNLAWLANRRYPHRKIVVWAATFHLMRKPSAINTGRPDLDYSRVRTMGHLANEILGNRYLPIGFIAHHGRFASFNDKKATTLKPAQPNSLEDLMHSAGLKDAILDLRNPNQGGSWLRRPNMSRPLGHGEMVAPWNEVLDAVVFNSQMTRSTQGDLPSDSDSELTQKTLEEWASRRSR
jgi:erythromycin esterase